MTTISEVLFIISNGLLLPVVILLLFLLFKSIWLALGFYTEFRKQSMICRRLQDIVDDFGGILLPGLEDSLGNADDSPVIKCFRDIITHREDPIYCEHSLADFQVDIQKKLSGSRVLIKFGPMLGLMGTLIPMGPALVGLVEGDIASMAYNMQVAFATTVIGMLVAGIGIGSLQIRQHFYAKAFNALEFILRKITANETKPNT